MDTAYNRNAPRQGGWLRYEWGAVRIDWHPAGPWLYWRNGVLKASAPLGKLAGALRATKGGTL